MVFCDPPYGVNYSGSGSVSEAREKSRKGAVNKSHVAIQNDALNDDAQYAFWLALFAAISGAIKDGAAYYICSPQGGRMMLLMQAMLAAGIPNRHEIIWNKNSFVMGRADYHYKHEPILYGWKDGASHQFFGGRSQSSVWDIPRPQKADLHPTMKPVELVARAIANSSKRGDIVLDLCGGSGTTLIAAEQTGRVARVCEIAPGYVDVIITRWETLTGRKAVKLS
jgi:DNA modification methylase